MTKLSACAEQVRQYDYDRFVTTLFAAPQDREALTVLYAFNAEVARVRESVREPLLGHIRLQWWRDALTGVFGGAPPRHAVAEPLAETIRRCGLDRTPFDAILDARASDMDDFPPPSLAALERYAEGTSASLMRLALAALGVRGEDAQVVGHDVAVAWALIGTARAIPFQALRQRSMLPADLCEAEGVSEEDRFRAPAAPGVRRVVESLAERAAGLLADARAQRAAVPKAAIPALLTGALADGHLRRLRASGYDIYDRSVQQPPTPTLLIRAALAALRGRY